MYGAQSTVVRAIYEDYSCMICAIVILQDKQRFNIAPLKKKVCFHTLRHEPGSAIPHFNECFDAYSTAEGPIRLIICEH